MNKYDEIKDLITEVKSNLGDIFFCGFNVNNEFILAEIERLSNECENFGLDYANQQLKHIRKLLDEKRHEFKFNYNDCIELYCKLNEYCLACEKRLEILRLKDSI